MDALRDIYEKVDWEEIVVTDELVESNNLQKFNHRLLTLLKMDFINKKKCLELLDRWEEIVIVCQPPSIRNKVWLDCFLPWLEEMKSNLSRSRYKLKNKMVEAGTMSMRPECWSVFWCRAFLCQASGKIAGCDQKKSKMVSLFVLMKPIVLELTEKNRNHQPKKCAKRPIFFSSCCSG